MRRQSPRQPQQPEQQQSQRSNQPAPSAPPAPPAPPAPSTGQAQAAPLGNKKGLTPAQTEEPEQEEYKVHKIEDATQFDRLIEEAGNRIVFIEFYAEWCGPCKLIGRDLEDLAVQYGSKLLIIKIDVDDFEELAVKHDVTMMPTFIVMQNKKKLEQFSGSSSEKVINAIERFCGEPENSIEVEDAVPITPAPKIAKPPGK